MATTALIVIDAQQEYFAPLGKVVLPGGPAAVTRIASALAWARAEIHPDLAHRAREPQAGRGHLLVSGFMTQMCVDTTARQAAHLGFGLTVLADATAAKAVQGPDGVEISADQVHRTHLGSLQGFLADIKIPRRHHAVSSHDRRSSWATRHSSSTVPAPSPPSR
jgi:nicotinamidase-related amidase